MVHANDESSGLAIANSLRIEPSNMLDVPSITYLAGYLQGYPSTVLGSWTLLGYVRFPADRSKLYLMTEHS
jgi:hypothetical protein